MSQFCTNHDSSAVVVCAKLLHDVTIRMTIIAKKLSQDFNHALKKPYLKWAPDIMQSVVIPDEWWLTMARNTDEMAQGCCRNAKSNVNWFSNDLLQMV